jgi:probable HAF family extracellular repeat protein
MNSFAKAMVTGLLASLIAPLPASSQEINRTVPGYRITELDPGTSAINNLGQTVGNFQTPAGVTHGFIETNGIRTDLGSLGGYSLAGAINDRSEVAGVSQGIDGYDHLFLYSAGTMRDLGVLGANARVAGLSNRGEITGNHTPPGRGNVAFLYTRGRLQELVPPDKVYQAYSRAINERGEVAGVAGSEDAVIWQGGRTRVIGPRIASWSLPEDINDRGDLVGAAGFPGTAGPGDGRAFLYSNGRVTNLGTLGGPFSFASAVNNYRQIVGGAQIGFLDTRAFLYERGALYNLNDLVPAGSGWLMDAALDINDRGQILVSAARGAGYHILRNIRVRYGTIGLSPAALRADEGIWRPGA